jgi:hypothetical protein
VAGRCEKSAAIVQLRAAASASRAARFNPANVMKVATA